MCGSREQKNDSSFQSGGYRFVEFGT